MSRLHKDSYIKSIEASVRGDHTDVLHKTKVPPVVVGEFDRLTPPELAEILQIKLLTNSKPLKI